MVSSPISLVNFTSQVVINWPQLSPLALTLACQKALLLDTFLVPPSLPLAKPLTQSCESAKVPTAQQCMRVSNTHLLPENSTLLPHLLPHQPLPTGKQLGPLQRVGVQSPPQAWTLPASSQYPGYQTGTGKGQNLPFMGDDHRQHTPPW